MLGTTSRWIGSRRALRFADFVSSPFLSLFSHLVAPFIAACVSGGSFFRHIWWQAFILPPLGCFSSSPASLCVAGGCDSDALGMCFLVSW
ncbi:hypothetical protein F2Q70_00040836 [Brassica cretica]|uniref:Uncharacterized protein n=1 Tax=Brassica cretica TaxID=69181 RepID=A0A8S9K4Y5_BRACR|nr:hypothetical protein F2Q70_00040836 [Brassica cretica]